MLLMQRVMMNTQINEQMHCCLLSENQGYQRCKCDGASFNMMCDVQYANTEQYLVKLFDFRLLKIKYVRRKLKRSGN